jgi:proteic killer suppression protein
MIRSFGNALAEELFDDAPRKSARRFPKELWRTARRKLQQIHEAECLDDLRIPPGNHLEKLKGDLAGFHSIRINDQWRIVFRWEQQHAYQVSVVDYH